MATSPAIVQQLLAIGPTIAAPVPLAGPPTGTASAAVAPAIAPTAGGTVPKSGGAQFVNSRVSSGAIVTSMGSATFTMMNGAGVGTLVGLPTPAGRK
jgi:hypothetical protein